MAAFALLGIVAAIALSIGIAITGLTVGSVSMGRYNELVQKTNELDMQIKVAQVLLSSQAPPKNMTETVISTGTCTETSSGATTTYSYVLEDYGDSAQTVLVLDPFSSPLTTGSASINCPTGPISDVIQHTYRWCVVLSSASFLNITTTGAGSPFLPICNYYSIDNIGFPTFESNGYYNGPSDKGISVLWRFASTWNPSVNAWNFAGKTRFGIGFVSPV